jgi:hypothetical protein
MRSYLNDDALTDTELKLRTPAVKAVIAAIKSRIETLTAEEVGKAVREGRDPHLRTYSKPLYKRGNFSV